MIDADPAGNGEGQESQRRTITEAFQEAAFRILDGIFGEPKVDPGSTHLTHVVGGPDVTITKTITPDGIMHSDLGEVVRHN